MTWLENPEPRGARGVWNIAGKRNPEGFLSVVFSGNGYPLFGLEYHRFKVDGVGMLIPGGWYHLDQHYPFVDLNEKARLPCFPAPSPQEADTLIMRWLMVWLGIEFEDDGQERFK